MPYIIHKAYKITCPPNYTCLTFNYAPESAESIPVPSCTDRVPCSELNDLVQQMVNYSETSIIYHAVLAATNGVSVVVCLLAVILVLRLKLYKTIVYRLALYQVLLGLVLASVGFMQGVFINYVESPKIHGRICTAIGLLKLYTEWMKLLFTMWVTFHLFYFAVLHKNLKKLEMLYIVTSLLVPALIAIVPLVTHSYGVSSDGNICYIYANTSVSFIERLALWDGPAMLMLIAASTAMVVMVIKLARQVRRRFKYEPITDIVWGPDDWLSAVSLAKCVYQTCSGCLCRLFVLI